MTRSSHEVAAQGRQLSDLPKCDTSRVSISTTDHRPLSFPAIFAGLIAGAMKHHGLNIDYCGVWNESHGGDIWDGPRLDVPWIKLLRRTLDCRGLSAVKIIARDLDGGRDQPRTWMRTTWTTSRAAWPVWEVAGTTPCSTKSRCASWSVRRGRGGVNLAAGKEAAASSNFSDSFGAPFANDGHPATRWNAAVGNEAGPGWKSTSASRPASTGSPCGNLTSESRRTRSSTGTAPVGATPTAARPSRSRGERIFQPYTRTGCVFSSLQRQGQGGFQNGVQDAGYKGIDWNDWNGRPTGYEGYLADSYRFLQAVLLREPSFRERLYRPLTPSN